MEPTQAEIDKLKAAHPDRALKLLTLEEKEGESLSFIVTGPNKIEYEKLLEDVDKIQKMKGEAEQIAATRKMMETLALQQIRWPERKEAAALFEKYPTISMQIGDKVRSYAGDSFEVREKKL